MSRTFAYCRVSTLGQTNENQALEIAQAGFAVEPHRVIVDTISGSSPAMSRPGFARLVDRLESEDVLIVTKLDRLGRSAMDVRSVVETLAKRGVRTHCLALGGVDLTSAAGKMTLGVIAAVAEMERDLLIERTQSGLARAKAEGKRIGRPPLLTDSDKASILTARKEGVSLGELANRLSVSKSAIQRAVKSAPALALT